MQRYRFLLKPGWIVLTVLVAAAVIAMVLAGRWQLRRLDERVGRLALVAARTEAAATRTVSTIQPGLSRKR